MLHGPIALVATSCNSCRSWCWNNLSKSFCLAGVSWWISHSNSSIALCRSASAHIVATCWALFRRTWNWLSFDVVTFSAPYSKPPLHPGFYESFVLVNDGILLPIVHPLWHLQTSIFSDLESHPSSCIIASVHHPVLRGIDQSDFVGWQVESIHTMPALLQSPFH